MGGAGGGGRIAIWRAPQLDTAVTGTWTIAVNGGTAGYPEGYGGTGTFFFGALTLPVEPSLSNRVVSGMTPSSAALNGYVLSTGSADTVVTVYWGTTDGGTNGPLTWQNTNVFPGIQVPGPVSTNVPVDSNTLYYYRYHATNIGGGVFAPNGPVVFFVGEVNVLATDSNASEVNLDPGVFTVSRPAAATNGLVTVFYTVGGTASNGVDCDLLSGQVTMAVGESNATITVTPIADALVEGPETVLVTLSGDAYLIGGSNAATVTIADQATAPINIWSGAGNWTNRLNWSAGHKPVDGQTVIVNGDVILAEPTASMGAFILTNATITMTRGVAITVCPR